MVANSPLSNQSNDTKVIIQGKYLPDSDSFRVSIQNQGILLRPEHTDMVFDRGFRSEEAKRKYPAGTGFGLYIARRIVEIHEGRITASSCKNPTGNDWINVFQVTLSVKGLHGKARVREY